MEDRIGCKCSTDAEVQIVYKWRVKRSGHLVAHDWYAGAATAACTVQLGFSLGNTRGSCQTKQGYVDAVHYCTCGGQGWREGGRVGGKGGRGAKKSEGE